MQASNRPTRIQLPFANSGSKNTIPVASQIGVTPGAASYTDGFPPLTFTPIASGGVPPAGGDFNGILNAITAIQQWQSGGGLFTYDATWSTANTGYPKGALLQSADEATVWLSTADNNATDPDGATPAGWVSLAAYGITAVAGLTNANVTLSSTQYGKDIITLAGTLTGNVQIIFPTSTREWLVINNTTGQFTVTCKTAAGTGVAVTRGGYARLYGDGTNIKSVSNAGRLIGIQVFSANGTYTPTTGMASIYAKIVGGGASGGSTGSTTSGQTAGGGGGASGSYAEGSFTAAQVGASQAITIGTGGTPSAAGANNGNNGNTTSLGSLMSAPGGLAGLAGVAGSTFPVITPGGKTGSIATGGLINSPGNPGGHAYLMPTGTSRSGNGGASPLTGGGGGDWFTPPGAGNAGNAPGAGGSGAFSTASDIARQGGAGADGEVMIFEYA